MVISPVVAGGASTSSNQPSVGDQAVARPIRFAAYLLGGVVSLAFGASQVATSSTVALDCYNGVSFCPSSYGYTNSVPGLVAGSFLFAVSIVLFVLAHRSR